MTPDEIAAIRKRSKEFIQSHFEAEINKDILALLNHIAEQAAELKKYRDIEKERQMKKCTKCGQKKPFTEYYQKGNGCAAICRECERAKGRKYYVDHKDDPVSEEKLERKRAAGLKYARKKSGRKERLVRREAREAMRRGDIERQPCEVCGDPDTEMHHDDYDKPLEVRHLCRPHHMELHDKLWLAKRGPAKRGKHE